MKEVEKCYKCKNGVVEKTRFYVGDNTRIFRGKRKASKERKQEQNMQSCVRKVARILNCNYSHDSGLLLTLDLDEPGINKLIGKLSQDQQELLRKLRAPVGKIGTWSAAGKRKKLESLGAEVEAALSALRDQVNHQVTLWLRRIKRKHTGFIKALMVVSDMDHETGELVRCHCHIVLAAGGISWDLLRKEWKLGSVDIRQLRNQPDYTPIAVYLMKQVRKQPDKKKYRVTQGMELPEVTERLVVRHTEIKAPAGSLVLERSEFNIDSMGQYIRYIPRKQEKSRKKRFVGEDADHEV